MRKKVRNELARVKKELAQLDRKQNQIANGRLVMAIVVVIGVLLRWKNGMGWGVWLALAAAVGFVWLVRQDGKTEETVKYIEARKRVLERYIAREGEEWREFADEGKEFLEEGFTQGIDLDLFGKNSLFQYISAGHTAHGRRALARALKGEYLAEAEERAESVTELIGKVAFAWELESAAEVEMKGKVGKAEYMRNFLRAVRRQEKGSSGVLLLTYGLPIVTWLAIVLALSGRIGFLAPIVLVGMQLMLNMSASGAAQEKMELLHEMAKPLAAYSRLSEIILREEFQSAYLREQQSRLKQGGSAQEGLRGLSNVLAMLEVQNSLLYLPLCGLLMWNYLCLLRFDRWCEKYSEELPNWLEAVGEVESLISLAMIGYVKQEYCQAEIVQSEVPFVEVEEAKHPLLSDKTVVGNSFAQDGGLCVITGSNMSGKTTFMRTLGVNLTLAYAGGVVCAKKFRAAKMKVLTSMRISDDVSKGISTFYGELLRIREMVRESEKGVPMIALIDEIFKGTNSADRIIGAKATLKSLVKPWVFVMVTTHDFELCDLANEVEKGSNYHFAEYYEDGKLCFDYKIKENRCETSNAKELMRLVGLTVE